MNGAFNRKNFLSVVKMATTNHENHDEYMTLGDILADKCGDIEGERCDQAISFDKCLDEEVKKRGVDIPFL